MVKVFPANIVGPQFFRDLRGPLPQIPLMPTGGVDFDTAPAFIKAGAYAVGVGGALAGSALMAKGDYAAITRNAQAFIRVVREAKESE